MDMSRGRVMGSPLVTERNMAVWGKKTLAHSVGIVTSKVSFCVQKDGSQKFLSPDLEHGLPIRSVGPRQVDFYKDVFGC